MGYDISLAHRDAKQLEYNRSYLLVVLVIASGVGASLEGLDLGSNVLHTLLACEPRSLVFLGLRRPVLILLCWLESGVLPDGCIGVFVDILDVSGPDVISEVGRELLLEPEYVC